MPWPPLHSWDKAELDPAASDSAGRCGESHGYIFEFGQLQLLDLEAAGDEPLENRVTTVWMNQLVNTHSFWKIAISGNGGTLLLTPLDVDWAHTFAKKQKFPHYYQGGPWCCDTLILMADPNHLSKGFARHINDPEAFPDRDTLVWSKR